MAIGFIAGGGGRRGRRRGGRTPMSEINVTPLVDVMLVLLIIFMVTAPLLTAGVPVDLPESRAKALGEQADQVTISMARDGRVFLDEGEVAPGELADRLSGIERGIDGKLPLVTLRADKGLDYGRVMGVMGELNRAGFNAISLVTSAAAAEPSAAAAAEPSAPEVEPASSPVQTRSHSPLRWPQKRSAVRNMPGWQWRLPRTPAGGAAGDAPAVAADDPAGRARGRHAER